MMDYTEGDGATRGSGRRARGTRCFSQVAFIVSAILSTWIAGRSEAANAPLVGNAYEVPGLGLKLLPVKPGTFTMGNDTNGKSDERPTMQVTITQAYWLGATEVTQTQWEAVMGKNPSHSKGADRPVENMLWEDAMEFCRKLNERELAAGRVPEGYRYTLPTEAQWEYACRAGTRSDYAGNIDEMGWHAANSGGETKPVAAKRPNAWGFYDMHGNVWEWCSDWYGFYPGGKATDPVGVAASSNRVNRGGCFWDHAFVCRSSYRNGLGLLFLGMNLGLRVALAPTPRSP